MVINLVINKEEKIIVLTDGVENFQLNEYNWLKLVKELKDKKTQLHIRTDELTKAKINLAIEMNPKYDSITELVQAAIDKEIPLDKFKDNLKNIDRVDLEFFQLVSGAEEAHQLIHDTIENILRNNEKVGQKITDFFEEKEIEIEEAELWNRIKRLQAEAAVLTEILHKKYQKSRAT